MCSEYYLMRMVLIFIELFRYVMAIKINNQSS